MLTGRFDLSGGYDWAAVERNRAFVTDLFCGPPPDRPAAVLHTVEAGAVAAAATPPDGLDELERQAWNQVDGLRRRPPRGHDFVPTLGTGAGTCAMATAFGCEETQAANVYWVKPCIETPAQIDRLRMPQVTAGKLGRVLEQTRVYAASVDDRLPIRVMDFQSPFTTVEQMLGSELFFLMPYDDPRRLHALMDLVTDYAIAFFRAQMKLAGPSVCPGIWPSIWFPRQAGIQMSDDNLVNVSPEVYDEFVVPYNNRIAEAFDGLFLHSCTIREANLPSLHKLKRLTGINCDISTSVSTARLLGEFGERVVIAPHAYINTDTNFASYSEFMANVLSGWQPGRRLFIYPCTVMYIPARAREIPFSEAEARAALERIPGWRRDHGGR